MMKRNAKYRLSFSILAFIYLALPCAGQELLTVSGRIISGNREPVANVSVSVRGSSQLPQITDSTGMFSLDSVPGDAWLIVAPAGRYKTRRILLDGRTSLEVYLTENDLLSGDDPVTLLTQQMPRRNLIPAQSELGVDHILESNILSVDQYMQGRVPGMFVVNRSGMPGSGAVTSIRGVNSINASNQPLYVIDGIPLSSPGIFGSNLAGYAHNPLLDINPLDISRAIIIRDPTIAATYGARASNGLIFIETLDPSVTQTSIDVDLRFGYAMAPSNLIPQLNADQNKTLLNEVLFTSGMYEEDIRELYPGLYLEKDDENYINYQHNTDWQKLIFDHALMSNMNIEVKGGDEIARYGLSFGYAKSGGVIKTTGYQAYNLRFVGRLNIFTWLKMNAGVSLNSSGSKLKEAATVEQTSPILASLAKSPLLNPYQYDIDGNQLDLLAEVDELGTSNPLAILDNYEARNNNYSFYSMLGLEGTINDHLSLISDFNISYNVLKEQIFMPNHGMEHYYNDEAINVSKATNNDLNTFYNHTYLRYIENFGDGHRLVSNTGLRINTNKFELDWGLTKNAPANDQYRDLQNGQFNLDEIGGANRNWNSATLYEYVTYSYRDKYFITGTVDFDGSSRVGRNAANTFKIGNIPVGTFYSGGLAWRISNESFLKNLSFLEDLKIRLTAGRSGNDDIGESSARSYYQAVRFRETVGLFPAVVSNDELTYETVSQVNAGLDLALYGNRFRSSVDLFRSATSNMIIYNPLQEYFGYDYRIENGGSMENQGIEASASLRIIDAHNFKWDIQAMVSTISNHVVSIEGEKKVYLVPGGEKVNMNGQPVYSFYGYLFKGVYSTQEQADAAGLVNDRLIPFRAGDAIFEDLSGPAGVKDGVINDFDKTIIGSPLPDLYGGFYTGLRYRRWDLSGFVQFVSGNDVFNYVRYKNEQMTGLANQSTSVLNRWQYDGQVTDIPRALWKDPVGNSDFSTRWIEDGSYLRLKNVTLSYTVPNEFLAFNYAEFYVSAINLYTLSKYLGYDPEFAYSHEQIDQGIDYGLMPQTRQFIAGIKIGF